MPKVKPSAHATKKSAKNQEKSSRRTPGHKAKSVMVDIIEDKPFLEEDSWSKDISPALPKKLKAEGRREKVWQKEPLKPDKEAGKGREEIDQQKKFFSALAAESRDKKRTAGKSEGPAKNLHLYRRLVFKFVILTAVLFAIVAYFSFSKLTITLTPKGEMISDSLLVKVTSDINATSSALAATSQIVPGTIKEIEADLTKTYPATGEEPSGEEITGQIRIINNYTKTQSLVATTRLLTTDNKLFRIRNGVTVPAGGQVSVDIYADKPSEDMAIGPTNFTIPGLWLGLQDKIYAVSDEAFTYRQKIKKYIKASDLDQADKDIKDALLKNAKAQAGGEAGDWLFDTSAPVTLTADAKAGAYQDEFSLTAQTKIIAVNFAKDQVEKLAAAKLNLLVPDNKQLAEFNPASIAYSLDNYDAKSGLATIKASFNGTMLLKSESQIVDRQQLVNLRREQIVAYLQSFPEIKNYELQFSPAFIHKAPSLVDRIKIKINAAN